jgi:hypothetical protein
VTAGVPGACGAGRHVEHLAAHARRRHDAGVRTTLTLDPDVVRLLEAAARSLRKSFKEIVNDALRRGLAPGPRRAKRRRYRVRPHAATLLPGLDRGRLNSLADELEDRAILGKRGDRRGA